LSIKLPLREWLELGQAMVDKSNILPRYFTKRQTEKIVIGKGITVEADGHVYVAGTYELME